MEKPNGKWRKYRTDYLTKNFPLKLMEDKTESDGEAAERPTATTEELHEGLTSFSCVLSKVWTHPATRQWITKRTVKHGGGSFIMWGFISSTGSEVFGE